MFFQGGQGLQTFVSEMAFLWLLFLKPGLGVQGRTELNRLLPETCLPLDFATWEQILPGDEEGFRADTKYMLVPRAVNPPTEASLSTGPGSLCSSPAPDLPLENKVRCHQRCHSQVLLFCLFVLSIYHHLTYYLFLILLPFTIWKLHRGRYLSPVFTRYLQPLEEGLALTGC